jgi:hypothetical protein
MVSYIKELGGESDRACALIVGAAISDVLRDLLRLYFIELDEDDINNLFYAQRASLGDFASRTDVSFALGLIHPHERLAANTIRRIRNAFAHTANPIEFSNELIVSELRKISDFSKVLRDVGPRKCFISFSMELYGHLLKRSSYLTEQRNGTGALSHPIHNLSDHRCTGGLGE